MLVSSLSLVLVAGLRIFWSAALAFQVRGFDVLFAGLNQLGQWVGHPSVCFVDSVRWALHYLVGSCVWVPVCAWLGCCFPGFELPVSFCVESLVQLGSRRWLLIGLVQLEQAPVSSWAPQTLLSADGVPLWWFRCP